MVLPRRGARRVVHASQRCVFILVEDFEDLQTVLEDLSEDCALLLTENVEVADLAQFLLHLLLLDVTVLLDYPMLLLFPILFKDQTLDLLLKLDELVHDFVAHFADEHSVYASLYRSSVQTQVLSFAVDLDVEELVLLQIHQVRSDVHVVLLDELHSLLLPGSLVVLPDVDYRHRAQVQLLSR